MVLVDLEVMEFDGGDVAAGGGGDHFDGDLHSSVDGEVEFGEVIFAFDTRGEFELQEVFIFGGEKLDLELLNDVGGFLADGHGDGAVDLHDVGGGLAGRDRRGDLDAAEDFFERVDEGEPLAIEDHIELEILLHDFAIEFDVRAADGEARAAGGGFDVIDVAVVGFGFIGFGVIDGIGECAMEVFEGIAAFFEQVEDGPGFGGCVIRCGGGGF